MIAQTPGAPTSPLARALEVPRPVKTQPSQPPAVAGGVAFRRLLLVANTHSRRGRRGLAEAERALLRLGCSYEVKLTSAGDVTEFIWSRRAGIDAVAVVGGDGTLNGVAKALLLTRLPLLVLPSGSANDLARTLQIPPNIGRAVELLKSGRLRSIDVGLANGSPFFNVASIGLGARVTGNLDAALKKALGPAAYPIATVKALLGARPFTARIRGAGWDVEVRTFQVSVGNGRYYGGGTPVEAQAQIDDGQLDLYSLEVGDLLRLLALSPRLRAGRQRLAAQVRVGACTKFEIFTRKPQPVSLYGEILTQTPVTFTIVPKAIRVFAPFRS